MLNFCTNFIIYAFFDNPDSQYFLLYLSQKLHAKKERSWSRFSIFFTIFVTETTREEGALLTSVIEGHVRTEIDHGLMTPTFEVPLSDVTVTDGDPATFMCKVTGVPLLEITWYMDKNEIRNGLDFHPEYTIEGCATQGLYLLRRCRLMGIWIPILNLRRSDDRLRFIMGIPILIRRRLLSE